MNRKWPLIISGTLAMMLSVTILGMYYGNGEMNAETECFMAESEEVDNFIVEDVERVKVGNFDVSEHSTEYCHVTLPATTETEPVVETTEAPTEESADETECESTTEATESEVRSPLYTCHGVMLPEEYQEYAYSLLCGYGMESYFPVWVCQCFQESSFQHDQRTLNHGHYDCGLMQIRETYWEEFQTDSGIFGDILDPYTNISVSVWLLSQYYEYYGGSIEETISHYMSGWNGEYMGQYVSDVLSHMSYLEEVR